MTAFNRWFRLPPFLLAAGLLLLGLAGCDGSSLDADGVRTELRFQAAPGTAKLNSHVQVDAAKLLIKSVKFNADNGEEYAFKTSSFVITLDLTGTTNTVVVGRVPEGSYERVTFKIHKPENNEAVPDPAFRDGSSGQQRYSVIVEGRVEGTPFVLKVRESIQQRIALTPPLVIAPGADAVAVTLLADVDRWFIDEDGRALDPRRADDMDEIEDAIKASFRALGTN